MSQMTEKFLLALAAERDRGVKEGPIANWGPDVSEYLKSAGVKFPAPWCAAFVTWGLKKAGAPKEAFPANPAAVYNWRQLAQHWSTLTASPKRGDLGGWVDERTHLGHIFAIAEVKTIAGVKWVRTIEGNTNGIGSREGTRVMGKWRRVNKRMFFIDTEAHIAKAIDRPSR